MEGEVSNLIDKVINDLEVKMNRNLNGDFNCIPFAYPRFRSEFPGLEKASVLTITSFTKGAKTQFASHAFIFEPLLEAYNNKKLKLRYLYFPLEETPERITQRFISFLLFKTGKCRISPRDLRSVDPAKPLPREILEHIKNDDYFKNILAFFEKTVLFFNVSNPTGIYKVCKQYAEENGNVITKKVDITDEFGNKSEISIFDSYKQNDEDEFVIPFIDTLNLVDTEKGLNKKQAIDKASEYCCKFLRNKYGMSPILIQQQSFEVEDNNSFKLNRFTPSVHTLGDSKYTGRDSIIVLGLFSPARFGLEEWKGYDIRKFGDSIRFLDVLVNRDGEMGGTIALYFDGATCTFKELPKPDEKDKLKKIYDYIENLKRQ